MLDLSFPPNSDMDYRIFHVCTWSLLRVSVNTGVGNTDRESAQHFWLGKTFTKIFLVLLTGFEPQLLGSGVWCSTPVEPPRQHSDLNNNFFAPWHNYPWNDVGVGPSGFSSLRKGTDVKRPAAPVSQSHYVSLESLSTLSHWHRLPYLLN